MKIRRILLTSDLSEEAERPYQAVADLARQNDATVRLLHVVEDLTVAPHGAPLAPPAHPPDLPRLVERARRVLEEHAGRLNGTPAVETDVVSAARVPEAIATYASEHGFDLIALSTHGRAGFRRMVMGSVAEQVLRRARVPVLVFPRRE